MEDSQSQEPPKKSLFDKLKQKVGRAGAAGAVAIALGGTGIGIADALNPRTVQGATETLKAPEVLDTWKIDIAAQHPGFNDIKVDQMSGRDNDPAEWTSEKRVGDLLVAKPPKGDPRGAALEVTNMSQKPIDVNYQLQYRSDLPGTGRPEEEFVRDIKDKTPLAPGETRVLTEGNLPFGYQFDIDMDPGYGDSVPGATETPAPTSTETPETTATPMPTDQASPTGTATPGEGNQPTPGDYRVYLPAAEHDYVAPPTPTTTPLPSPTRMPTATPKPRHKPSPTIQPTSTTAPSQPTSAPTDVPRPTESAPTPPGPAINKND